MVTHVAGPAFGKLAVFLLLAGLAGVGHGQLATAEERETPLQEMTICTPLRPTSFFEATCRHQALWGTPSDGLQLWCWPFLVATVEECWLRRANDLVPLQEVNAIVCTTPFEQCILPATDRTSPTTDRLVRLYASESPCATVVELDGNWAPGEGLVFRIRPWLLPMQVSIDPPPRPEITVSQREISIRSPRFPVHLRLRASAGNVRLTRVGDLVEVECLGPSPARVTLAAAVGKGPAQQPDKASRTDHPPGFIVEGGPLARTLQHVPWIKLGRDDYRRLLTWCAVSLDRLWVENPDLGRGLISGYGPLDRSQLRPRYAWFFDEPVLGCVAYCRLGMYAPVRDAFRMLRRFQRADGKPVHEITQSLRYWPRFFEEFPYAFMHTDSGPFYVVGHWLFWRATGDTRFLQEQWPSIHKAYRWCVAQTEPSGILPVRPGDWGGTEATTLIQRDAFTNGMWLVALRALAEMADAVADHKLASDALERYKRTAPAVTRTFWDSRRHAFLWGYRRDGHALLHPLPQLSIPCWLGAFEHEKVAATARAWQQDRFRTAWGVRCWPAEAPEYDPASYQHGSVWPVWTAGVQLVSLQMGHIEQTYAQWRQLVNAMFLPETNGHMPELLRGDRFELAPGSVQHQMFSHLAPVNVLIDGLLGIDCHVPRRRLTLRPSLPEGLARMSAEGLYFGPAERFSFGYRQSNRGSRLELDLRRLKRAVAVRLELPRLRTGQLRAELNGQTVPHRICGERCVVESTLRPARHTVELKPGVTGRD